MSDLKILHQNKYEYEKEKPRYGIWLILLAINLIAGFYYSLKTVVLYTGELNVWAGSYYLTVIALTAVALFSFWKRKPITPWLIMAYLTVNLMYAVLINYNILFEEGEVYYYSLFRSAFICLVAVPYLALSKHVKHVFVK